MVRRDAEKPIGVLYLINTWVVGGTETQLLTLFRHLDRTRYQPHVCAMYVDPKVVAAMADVEVPAFSLNIKRFRDLSTPLHLWQLVKYCRQHNIQIIQGVRADQVALVGRLAGVKVILGAQRTVYPLANNNGKVAQAKSFLDRFLTGVIANSGSAGIYRQKYSNLPPEKIHVIPNGLNVEKFQDASFAKQQPDFLPPNTPTLILLGRLDVKTKGHFYALDALQTPALADVHLIVVGDGEDRACLEAEIAQRDLQARVHLLGHRTDVANVLSMADLVVVASTRESSPNVILEAWGACRTVVATRVGGIPELVDDGETGLLVPMQDGQALAIAIAQLLENPDLRQQLAQNGHKRLHQQYSGSAMTQKTMALYDQVLSGK